MSDAGLTRIQYVNLGTGTPRAGSTVHGESLVDVDSYFSPLERFRNAAMFDWGVADGLVVQATATQPGLTVTPGTALDAAGRLTVLAAGGVAVVDPTVDPAQMVNVPTVPVPDAGLLLTTEAPGGQLLLTLTWREVQSDGILGNVPVLQHAPWLRLVPAAGFADRGQQVVLAAVTIAGDGTVSALAAGPRRRVGLPAGRLRLVAPQELAGAAPQLGVGQQASAEVAGVPGGGLVVTVPIAGGSTTALTVDGADAHVSVPALTAGSFTTSSLSSSSVVADTVSAVRSDVRGAAGAVFRTSVGDGGAWRLTDAGQGVDRLTVDGSGQLSMALPAGTPAQRIIHVEGGEIHSGGASGGFSFSDRSTGGFLDAPGFGERWVWYALGGVARLWSGRDILSLSLTQDHFPLIWFTPLLSLDGDLHVTGSILKGGGGFRIDHPLDPRRRYLNHSFVESPDMATLYAGTVRTGEQGVAEVQLPDYFSALNRDARLHLTAVSSLSAVTVDGPVDGNRFTIRSAEPSVTVNWLVTGVRHDAWARAHTIEVEVDKPESEHGRYLHPEAFGDEPTDRASAGGTG